METQQESRPSVSLNGNHLAKRKIQSVKMVKVRGVVVTKMTCYKLKDMKNTYNRKLKHTACVVKKFYFQNK